ncbi:MAG: DUF2283 domain-containing protein [Cyanobacteria bacterium J069]|nr:MAG: DUF2283 domain-containing protein [Cyanobacteria bacterium J069]
MAENLIFQYDREGDILYINRCSPYAEQESEEIGDDVIARLNPQTGEIENLEVLFFSQRLQDQTFLNLPIAVNFSLA